MKKVFIFLIFFVAFSIITLSLGNDDEPSASPVAYVVQHVPEHVQKCSMCDLENIPKETTQCPDCSGHSLKRAIPFVANKFTFDVEEKTHPCGGIVKKTKPVNPNGFLASRSLMCQEHLPFAIKGSTNRYVKRICFCHIESDKKEKIYGIAKRQNESIFLDADASPIEHVASLAHEVVHLRDFNNARLISQFHSADPKTQLFHCEVRAHVAELLINPEPDKSDTGYIALHVCRHYKIPFNPEWQSQPWYTQKLQDFFDKSDGTNDGLESSVFTNAMLENMTAKRAVVAK